ncbi:uncharacterized protein [Palaemon carinicauda]|uniref:uncharacterized protein n=1 Tax=Palaemon carinicauda TaxID=392227 RepID=UPI0035B6222C
MLVESYNREYDDVASNRREMSAEGRIWLEIIEKGVRKTGGRYEVPLPLRGNHGPLPETRDIALRRMHSLRKKLVKDGNYAKQYSAFMREMQQKGYAKRVTTASPGNVWYIPHFGVQHPDKVRVVFDCASKVEGTSLNDLLLQGPNMMNSLLGVLVKFRGGLFAYTGDINTMFYQWDLATDELGVRAELISVPRTKGNLLSAIASIYDPLGILAPVLIEGRVIMQDLCRLNIAGDMELDPDTTDLIKAWAKRLSQIKLSAAVLAVRLGSTILTMIDFRVDGVYYWTDSTTVLRYIRNDQARYQTFVANRVSMIREGSDQKEWSLVREKFWVIKGHAAVRCVLSRCVRCRRAHGKAIEQLMADLPPDRVESGKPPFYRTGVDLFGPFFVKRVRAQMKHWGVIFTCLNMRAIHLEVASNLTSDSFISAFRRFLARRGLVKTYDATAALILWDRGKFSTPVMSSWQETRCAMSCSGVGWNLFSILQAPHILEEHGSG